MEKVTLFQKFWERSERRKRIGIDIDKQHLREDPWKVLRAYFTLKTFFPKAQVKVMRTGKGFHIKAIGEEIALIPIEKRVEIREKLCDDPERLWADHIKLRLGLECYADTLFSSKIYPDGTRGQEEEIDPIALPWFTRRKKAT